MDSLTPYMDNITKIISDLSMFKMYYQKNIIDRKANSRVSIKIPKNYHNILMFNIL